MWIRDCQAPIEQWTKEERAELAVPEYDPDYLPPGMQPPSNWFTASGVYVGVTITEMTDEEPTASPITQAWQDQSFVSSSTNN